jgi:hypothetical protein
LRALRELQTDRVARVNHPVELVHAAKQEAPLASPTVLPDLNDATYRALLGQIDALGDLSTPWPPPLPDAGPRRSQPGN